MSDAEIHIYPVQYIPSCWEVVKLVQYLWSNRFKILGYDFVVKIAENPHDLSDHRRTVIFTIFVNLLTTWWSQHG